jgi:hypothetical protein
MLRIGNVLVLISMVLFGCMGEEAGAPNELLVERSFFDSDEEGWIAEFADYPMGLEDSMKLSFSHSPIYVSESIGSVSAVKQSGYATNSDLFMFIKQQISGLVPNSRYTVKIEVELNTQLVEKYDGNLDNKDYGSFLKVGAFKSEPLTKEIQDTNNPDISIVTTDFDKGIQMLVHH